MDERRVAHLGQTGDAFLHGTPEIRLVRLRARPKAFGKADHGFAELRVALVRLSDAEGNTAGILEISEGDDLRYLPLNTGQPADGRVLQLWTSFDEAAGPVRLGIVSHAGPLRWRGPHLPPPLPGQTYSVTAAAPADAAPGRPFGETLFQGTAERLPRP